MPYKIAGIDVHKKMLAVVVSDASAYACVCDNNVRVSISIQVRNGDTKCHIRQNCKSRRLGTSRHRYQGKR